MGKLVVKMKPFVFEDGNIYYFQLYSRGSSSRYYDLYVYEEVISPFYKFFNKNTKKTTYRKINNSSKLVSTRLSTREIKNEITDILKLEIDKNRLEIDGWDGFVGDVPEEFKKSLKREAKLNDILKR